MNAVETKNQLICINKKNNLKRDYMVDIIRIVACAIVVLVHTNDLGMGFVDKGRIFWGVLLGDGVTIFFMITGFFLFKNKSYKKLLKKTFINILLPAIALAFFSWIFWDLVSCKTSLNEWATELSFKFDEFTKCVINFKYQKGCDHLWYIDTYIKIIIFYPVLKLIVDNKKVLKYCVGISLIAMIYNDVNSFIGTNYKLDIFNFFETPIVYVLIGNILYNLKDKIKGDTKFTIIAVCFLIFTEILRYFLQYLMFENDLGNNRYIYWDSSFACVCSSLFILIILSMDLKNEKIGNTISFIGQRTFMIYLIHPLVISFLKGVKFRDYVLSKLGYVQKTMNQMNFESEVIYIFSRFFIEFIISLVLSIMLYKIKKIAITIYQKIFVSGWKVVATKIE